MLLLHKDILKEIEKNVSEISEIGFEYNYILISENYLIFFNTETNKYICFKHYFGKNLIETLIYIDFQKVFKVNSFLLSENEYLKENYLMKYESFIKKGVGKC